MMIKPQNCCWAQPFLLFSTPVKHIASTKHLERTAVNSPYLGLWAYRNAFSDIRMDTNCYTNFLPKI